MTVAELAHLDPVADEHPRRLIFATVSGAHLYGFPSPDSDFDLRGVHLKDLEALTTIGQGLDTIEKGGVRDGIEIDLVTHDARKFFRLMMKPNGYVLEQLYSPLVVRTSPEHEALKAIGAGCITRRHVAHYLGFARNQWDLVRKESPPRVKPLLYVYRVLLTGIHLMRTGRVEASLPVLNEDFGLPFIDELLEAKRRGPEKGTLDDAAIERHETEYAKLVEQLEAAGEASTLPELPSAGPALDALLLQLRLTTLGAG